MEKLHEKDGFEAATVSGNADDTSSGDETNQTIENRKRKERDEESSSEEPTDGEDDSHVQKKKRVIWTSEMHQKFVDAIAQLGHDKAFPKKIVELMNEPGLTRENVASHLQKYRICLKKSQEVTDKYHSQDHFQQHYMGSSHLASRNYLSISSSSDFSNYGIGTSIGASRVRLAPPSYSSFDVSSLSINTGNVQNQYNQRNMQMSILNTRPNGTTSEDHAAIAGTTNTAFMGLRIANDGKSLLFGGSEKSEIGTSQNYSTKGNEFHCQESCSPMFRNSNVENYVQGSALPQLRDSNFGNYAENNLLPPLPEVYVESSENDPFGFIPQQEITSYGTNLQTADINYFSSGQQNYLQKLPWETLESGDMDMINTNIINQEDHLPPLPSEMPSLNSIPQVVLNEQNLLPSLPLDQSQWNVNSDASTMAGGDNILDQQSVLPPLPSEIPWNLETDLVPQPYDGDFFDEQYFVSSSFT